MGRQRVGPGMLGPLLYFQTSGALRLRVQTGEDGLSIDQIVLSPDRYLTSSPGAIENDNTILIWPCDRWIEPLVARALTGR